MRKGFTLVELAIVLIIIGILIAGILVARSMISTANVTKTISQLDQFDAGVANFQTKYNSLPGDSVRFVGDGDGMIEVGSTPTSIPDSTDVFICEVANFWSNIMPDQYASSPCDIGADIAPVINGANKNVPVAKLGTPNAFFTAGTLGTGGGVAALPARNVYAILHSTQAQATTGGWHTYNPTTATTSAVRAIELQALDTKTDDGFANSGNVFGGSIVDEGGGYADLTGVEMTGCSAGAEYTVSGTDYICTPIILVGSRTGLVRQ